MTMMNITKLLKVILVLSVLSLSAAFLSPLVVSQQKSRSSSLNVAAAEGRDVFLHKFGLICGGILATGQVPPSAFALPDQRISPESSMLVAEAIKTLDMSLPSYSDISSSKASVENVKSLSVDPATTKAVGVSSSTRKTGMSSYGSSSSSSSSSKKKKSKSSSMPGYDF
ncbi:hypothetical protein ACA910_001300 [Epithemia clementina (nom. ined.)]